jgi:hypothetical protein
MKEQPVLANARTETSLERLIASKSGARRRRLRAKLAQYSITERPGRASALAGADQVTSRLLQAPK